MSRRWIFTVGFSSLIVVSFCCFSSGQVQAQTTANGPYYAMPSWDQTLPAATRFVILSNFSSQAVLDRETGLVWERSPRTDSQPWANARDECTRNRIGNRKGWRLPTVHELASLIDLSVTPPNLPIPEGHPFTNVQSRYYWSASTDADIPTAAWVVDYFDGTALRFGKGLGFPHVWCVRGGSNADAY